MTPAIWLFMWLYMFSFIMVLSFEDWFLIWVGLEINMFSFIVFFYGQGNIDQVESIFKYFFIQSLSSSLILMSMYVKLGMVFFLSLSMGLGPFFFWYLSVVKGMTWMGVFFLMIFQSVVLFFLMLGLWGSVFLLVVFFSMILSFIGILMESGIKSLMAYSSLNQVSWVLISQSFSRGLWIIYMFYYGVLSFFFISFLMSENIFELKDLFMKSDFCVYYVIMMLTGIPPLMMFFLKVWIIVKLSVMDFVFSVVVVFVSLIMFYVYLRVLFRIMLFLENINLKKYSFKMMWILLLEVVSFLVFFFFEVSG